MGECIGKNIYELRRQKGITQEALAEIVGVTGQAVSKWESGGSPDIELLPPIADYFGVSIDKLFGRKIRDYSDIMDEVADNIASIDNMHDRFKRVFDFCWTMELAISSAKSSDDRKTVDDVDDGGRMYSQMLFDEGCHLWE